MLSIKTKVIVDRETSLRISHQPRTELTRAENSACVVESNEQNNILSTVRCDSAGQKRCVYVFWCDDAASNFDCVLLTEDHRLFVGAGQVSAVIDLIEMQIVEFREPMLFWGFERVGSFIVEYGELECVLYSTKGVVLDEAQVDPPYNTRILEHAINFASICAGSTWLKFPKM